MDFIIDGEKYNVDECGFIAPIDEYTRYLKGKYRNNLERCKGRFIIPLLKELKKNGLENHLHNVASILHYWDISKPYNYREAFEIVNDNFRGHVFSSIDIREMINHLGAVRIKTEGIQLKNKVYNEYTGEFTEVDYDYVAELHQVNGEKLGLTDEILYVLKLWCTSTNKEHWLWVDETQCNINSPLDAVASTCIVYEPMVGNIKHIIRQGDVFIFEMKDKVNISSSDKKVRLSKEMYFDLLKSQA